MKQRKQSGFSLIELLVVVAILMIISAIAIGKLLSARTAALEGAAVSTTRNLATALTLYETKYGSFPGTLTPLGGTCNSTTPPTPTLACLVDTTILTNMTSTSGQGQYVYTYIQLASGGFTLNANPAPGSSATRHLYVDDGLTIHTNSAAAASITDPTI